MRMWGPINVFTQAEEDRLHHATLRILAETGVEVQDEAVLDRLAALGGSVEKASMRVRFPADFTERFIAESEPFDWDSITADVRGQVSIYFGYFLNPETDAHEPWTLPRYFEYLKVGHHLPNSQVYISYPAALAEVPGEALAPFFHYLALKFSGGSASGIDDARWCPLVLDMTQAAAAATGRTPQQVFRGGAHLISPLKLAREEARIYLFFAERGLKVGVGSMTSAGGSAPVTLAGAMALHLAESLFLNMLQRAFFGDRMLSVGCSISALDMRTGMYPYGRPEKEICNVALAQMARRYRARYGPHCGHSDAKRPSVEAGFQKALRSIPSLMACGLTRISCGLLSVDEVFSPIQMILDDEMVGALRRFARGFEVTDETLAVDLIRQVGPGGTFLDQEHTLRHFRAELWEPRLFARQMFAGWRQAGARSAEDIAMEMYRDLVRREPLPSLIPDDLDRELVRMLRRATGLDLGPVDGEGRM